MVVVGADLCACPDKRANTQVRPYNNIDKTKNTTYYRINNT